MQIFCSINVWQTAGKVSHEGCNVLILLNTMYN